MPASKSAQLKRIQTEVESLRESPLYKLRQREGYHAVVGKGNPDARILFIGEAPGKQEAMQGEPFVGAAGHMLDDMLGSLGLERDQIYITNILKDRPPENRDPQKAEIKLYAPFLRRQINIIQLRIIVTLGRFAMESILEEFDLSEKGAASASFTAAAARHGCREAR